MAPKKIFNLSGDFGKAVLLWVSSLEGQKWRKEIQEQREKYDWEHFAHPFFGLKEDVKNRGYVNIFLKFDGDVSNMTQGFCFNSSTRELAIEQTKEGLKEMLPTFAFCNHQRKLGEHAMDDLAKLPLDERNRLAPRDPMGSIYADAKFALLKDLALVTEFHPWCKHRITNVTNCIQKEYFVKGSDGKPTKQSVEMPLETQVCRTKLLFAKKGFHEPTMFLDMTRKGDDGQFEEAQLDGEPVGKENVHRWLTSGSSNIVFENWDSIALSGMGKNIQIYVVKLITNHREGHDQSDMTPDDFVSNYAMGVLGNTPAEPLDEVHA